MRASRSIWYRRAVGSSKVSLSRVIAFSWDTTLSKYSQYQPAFLRLALIPTLVLCSCLCRFSAKQSTTARLAKPQGQTCSPTADVLAVIRLTADQPRLRGRGFETAEPAADRACFDVALVAAPFTTVVRSKTDVEAAGAVVTITPAAMQALDAIRPAGAGGEVKVFGLSESQIARRVKAVARAAGLADWEFFSGHSGRGGHDTPHGPERRAHPRDRTPGPLETGRRHGRPLHPRRISRVGAAVPVTAGLEAVADSVGNGMQS